MLIRKRSLSQSNGIEDTVVGQFLTATRAAAAGQNALLAGHRATQLLANANAALLLSKQRACAAAVVASVASNVSSSSMPSQAAIAAATAAGVPPPSHGTSAGFCTICKKFVSNRTNHKYVHSQVGGGEEEWCCRRIDLSEC